MRADGWISRSTQPSDGRELSAVLHMDGLVGGAAGAGGEDEGGGVRDRSASERDVTGGSSVSVTVATGKRGEGKASR